VDSHAPAFKDVSNAETCLWKFEKDKRSSVKWIRNTPTPSHQ
jgi:hypothetical protein